MPQHNHIEAIKAIKQAILKSRYQAAAAVNREMLSLYFGIGEYISQNSRKEFWGTNAIATISEQLQKELPGLRGFSATNLKNMRLFFEAWETAFINRTITTDEMLPLTTDNLQNDKNEYITNPSLTMTAIRQPITDELQKSDNNIITNRQLLTDDLESDEIQKIDIDRIINQTTSEQLASNQNLQNFVAVGFTHHIFIINKTREIDERLFYIEQCAKNFWSVEKLKYNLKSNLYAQQGSMINNFAQTISQLDFRGKALRAFKDAA
jgi:predicted nuclease of restriction endonuclease-like (RecB) superfamily